MPLSESFTQILIYVSHLLRSPQLAQLPYEEVKEEIQRLLLASERLAQESATGDDYQQARFAVCAWIDEVLLSSDWPHKNLWLKDQLQRVHYGTTDAGEQFFERLERLTPHQSGVREIFYLCLALGFTGRYCKPGDQHHLEQIRAANLKVLLNSPLDLPVLDQAELFPQARPGDLAQQDRGKAFPATRLITAICLGAPLLLFFILYLVYSFTLSGIGDHFLKGAIN